MWAVYQLLVVLGVLCYLPKALWRKRLPHRGWAMRLSAYPQAVRRALGARPSVWVHAVSVGEVMAVKPLAHRFLAALPAHPLVVSTVTPSGFQVAHQWLGSQGVTIYSPLDLAPCVGRALKTISPKILILVESELWPTLIRSAVKQRVPVVVVNGRISERAYRGYLRVKPWMKGLLRSMSLLLMQTETDAARIIAVGASPLHVKVLGNLKWDACLLDRPRQTEMEALAMRLGIQPGDAVIVAGSTHRGEESALLEAVQALRARRHPVKLMLAPRHLERVGEIERLVARHRLSVVRCSRLLDAAVPWEVALVDSLGQLPRYYGLASVVVVGGSFIPHGGQNPLEPASLGRPIVFGPCMQNFAAIADQLLSHQAARQLTNGAALADTLEELLTNQGEAQAMGRRAQELIEQARGATERTFDVLLPLLSTPSASP